MATKYLGATLRHPRRRAGPGVPAPRERARAVARRPATASPDYWMHNGLVTMAGEKMSKSLGNTLLVREIVRERRAVEVRYYLGAAHYRSTIEYSADGAGRGRGGLPAHRELRRARLGGRRAPRARRGAGSRSPPPWTTTSACRPRSACVHDDRPRAATPRWPTATRAAVREALGQVLAMTGVLGLTPSAVGEPVRGRASATSSTRSSQRRAGSAGCGARTQGLRGVGRDPRPTGRRRCQDRGHPRRPSLDGDLMPGNSERRGAVRKQKKGATRSARAASGDARSRAGARPRRPRSARAIRRRATRPRRRPGATRRGSTRKPREAPGSELLVGRNPVAEALRAKIPATALYLAQGIAADERITEAVRLAGNRGIALLEVSRAELDRRTGGIVHQGIALQVPPFGYRELRDLLADAAESGDAAAARRARRRHRPAQPRGDHPLGRRVRRARPGHPRAPVGEHHPDGVADVGRHRGAPAHRAGHEHGAGAEGVQGRRPVRRRPRRRRHDVAGRPRARRPSRSSSSSGPRGAGCRAWSARPAT